MATDLQGWQKVAREIGDYDLSDDCDGYSGSGCPTNLRLVGDRETVGDWLPAEAAAKEILRLRERVKVLEKSIRWALGEVDMDGWFPLQGPNDPRYWWRSGLRSRAALAAADQQQETDR